ncbi:hypothetical protein J8281_16515 [Aquimarina sp. U1-2]|uniref:hypothetical protein n=1 Tax=Aquimarina sp. U1-2 TaxID=2823141 RepID=UPI001AECD114|nr:hypothetical protein [Aquimarina sp. U1-2]MBP2833801.1 hypothetical protein [Aquimarina sp. U1-2]
MKTRNTLRWLHIIAAAAIGTFIYSPWASIEWFALTIQVLVIPVLTITGLWMWKPKWFKGKNKGAMRSLTILLALGFTLNSVNAQEKLRGGSGGFMLGAKILKTDEYQYFVREGGPDIENNVRQIGGEGYWVLNKWVLGGSGYYNFGDKAGDGNQEYKIQGGGGFLNVGYIVYHTEKLYAFPLLGIGVDALGIHREIDTDVAFEPDRFLSASYFIVRPVLDIGYGLDWFPKKQGFKVGIRAGFNYTLDRGNDWNHYGGEITNPDLPDNDLDGWYFRITIGGGAIKKVQKN